jgi:hypothetical protein
MCLHPSPSPQVLPWIRHTRGAAAARDVAYGGPPRPLKPERHFLTPRTSLISGLNSAQFLAAGRERRRLKAWQRWRAGTLFCSSWAADGPLAREFRLFFGQQHVLKQWAFCQRDACHVAYLMFSASLWPRARAQHRSVAAACSGSVPGRVCRREHGVYVLLSDCHMLI